MFFSGARIWSMATVVHAMWDTQASGARPTLMNVFLSHVRMEPHAMIWYV